MLIVLPVAPSPPICRIQGKVEYWQDITLTCLSEEGSPKPIHEWKSYSVENIPRPFPPKTINSKNLFYLLSSAAPSMCLCGLCVAEDGALSLFNISRETSGFYICTTSNRIGSARCNMTLAVLPGECFIAKLDV